jgi:hypothetical protein
MVHIPDLEPPLLVSYVEIHSLTNGCVAKARDSLPFLLDKLKLHFLCIVDLLRQNGISIVLILSVEFELLKGYCWLLLWHILEPLHIKHTKAASHFLNVCSSPHNLSWTGFEVVFSLTLHYPHSTDTWDSWALLV